MDATAALMNQLARRLLEARSNALEQIGATGWPVDIYHDVAWYPDLSDRAEKASRSSKKQKQAERAYKMRASALEIDVALAALNHFAETTDSVQPSSEPDAIIEALEASINAIEAFFAPDATIGQRQREHGKHGGESKERTGAVNAIHQAWAEEDRRLGTEKPRLSKSARAKLIAEAHNRRPENCHMQTKSETVRSALHRFNRRKLVS